MDDSLALVLESLSSALLGARLRAPESREMFCGGHAALALANAALAEVFPDRAHARRSASNLARAVDVLGRGSFAPFLFGGFTGLAWVAERLREDGDGEANDAIDEALVDYVSVASWRAPYDVTRGLVGYGVYALERLPRPSAVALLEAVVRHLATTAEPQREGLSWRSRPSWLPRALRTEQSSGFNLGVAHGVPGVIALLGRVWRAGIARRDVERLLAGAVAWLLAQELPATSQSAFASSVGRGHSRAPTRSAWCYGDPSIAAALLVAARATGERSWERAAIRIGARAAVRDPETCGVVDAGLCHGAAGLAHVHHRLFVETRDERFERAAHLWLGRTIAMHSPRRGLVGGFGKVRYTPDGRRLPAARDASFLTGSSGVALALAAFATPKRKGWAAWDRVLLLSDATP